jgi:endogenous inhibitor of DNA gyrase (YacG/DUF329 family)
MAMVSVKCPSCGGKVQMEKEMTSGFCVHCGNRMNNEKNVSCQAKADADLDVTDHLNMVK